MSRPLCSRSASAGVDAADRPDLVPALVWLLWRKPTIWRDAWLVVPTTLIAAFPWLVSSLQHDWRSFDVASEREPSSSRL